ncbi:hypothetical protein [Clostridium ihumii]|uniref:hypothetical protein n=1 Tax=Clostridium ihumii TaxID=1470356 RepID=UPI00055844C0|nr:hypothetical protein [Clostridium ihumii]
MYSIDNGQYHNNEEVKGLISDVLKSNHFAITPLNENDCNSYEINIKGDKYGTFKISNNQINHTGQVIDEGTLENGENWSLELY